VLKTKVLLTVVAVIVGLASGAGVSVAAANGHLPLFKSSDEQSEYDPPPAPPAHPSEVKR
jgi:hypothetical protein